MFDEIELMELDSTTTTVEIVVEDGSTKNLWDLIDAELRQGRTIIVRLKQGDLQRLSYMYGSFRRPNEGFGSLEWITIHSTDQPGRYKLQLQVQSDQSDQSVREPRHRVRFSGSRKTKSGPLRFAGRSYGEPLRNMILAEENGCSAIDILYGN